MRRNHLFLYDRPVNNAYCEVLLDNVVYNLNEIRGRLPGNMPIMAVIKDLSYGCGGYLIAKTMEEERIRFFCVARTPEAKVLRAAGIWSPILVMGQSTLEEYAWGAENNILFSLNDLHTARLWAHGSFPVRFHCNIDTGMNRLGVSPNEIGELLAIVQANPNLTFEGIFTHFSSADRVNTKTVFLQLDVFRSVCSAVSSSGILLKHFHFSNSAALARFKFSNCTLVRPGILLYGCNPDPAQDFGFSLESIVSLKAAVVRTKIVPAGTPISYGGNYVTDRHTCIATIPIGYAHGLPRLLSNKGYVLIKGKRYPIVGNVTMDYVIVDIGLSAQINVGDEAVAIGRQGYECISPDEIALKCNTIGYEVLCRLSTAIERYYLRKNTTIFHQKSFLFDANVPLNLAVVP